VRSQPGPGHDRRSRQDKTNKRMIWSSLEVMLDMAAREDVIVIGYEMKINKQESLYGMEFKEDRQIWTSLEVLWDMVAKEDVIMIMIGYRVGINKQDSL
jgi:hypothetical protein